MILMFLLNDILFRPNRVTHAPIIKDLCQFFVASFMYDQGRLESFVNIILLGFYLSWDLVDPTFTEDISVFTPPSLPLKKRHSNTSCH